MSVGAEPLRPVFLGLLGRIAVPSQIGPTRAGLGQHGQLKRKRMSASVRRARASLDPPTVLSKTRRFFSCRERKGGREGEESEKR